MLDCLVQDTINDTSIMMPCSILVFDKKAPGKKKCEFDGIVIHPMRVQDQIILFEAKKTLYKPLFAKNCLSKKLDSLCFEYAKDSIITTNHDAQLKLSIK